MPPAGFSPAQSVPGRRAHPFASLMLLLALIAVGCGGAADTVERAAAETGAFKEPVAQDTDLASSAAAVVQPVAALRASDGEFVLPAELASVEALQWFRDELAKEGTAIQHVVDRFSLGFTSQIPAANVVSLIDDIRQAGASEWVVADVRSLSEWNVGVVLADPTDPTTGLDVTIGLLPQTSEIDLFLAVPRGAGLAAGVLPEHEDMTIQEALLALDGLMEESSVLVADVVDGSCVTRFGIAADAPQGLASLFKLWTLGAVAEGVEAGELSAADAVAVIPGTFTPMGSFVTAGFESEATMSIGQLTTAMMAVSDNGASEILHDLVGRVAIDRFVGRSQHSRPERLTPMMTASDVSHMLTSFSGADIDAYVSGEDSAQSAVLDELAARGPFVEGQVQDFNLARLGWQSSADDVCGVLATLQIMAENDDVADLLDRSLGASVALNGLTTNDRVWFKGGSAGVIASDLRVLSSAWLIESDEETTVVVSLLGSRDDVDAATVTRQADSLHTRILELLTA